jgi:hypothetical protein
MYIIEHQTRGVLLELLNPDTGKPAFSPTILRGSERAAKYTTLRYAILDAQLIPGAYVVREPVKPGTRWQRLTPTGDWEEC